MPPAIFINCRDRVATLIELVSWLERAGCEEIYLLDNDSTYEPLLDYFRHTPHTVVHLGENYGRLALFEAPGVLERAGGKGFVYTDPDVVPADDCPLDALDHFEELLCRFKTISKVGFGLRIDDLPDHYVHKEAVLIWEQQFWDRPLEPGAYYAPIDTTFALYRPGSGFVIENAIRTGPPYVARHDTWYLDLANPSAEEKYYRARAVANTTHSPRTSHWSSAELPAELSRDIEALRRRVGSDTSNSGDPRLPAFEKSGWFVEPEPQDERLFTPWAEEGWHSWNETSPEVEFTEFLGALVRLLRPSLVVEAGVGQGFSTRRVADALRGNGRLLAYESDGFYRALLSRLPFFAQADCELAADPTPSAEVLRDADLTILEPTILDVDGEVRLEEIRAWATAARPGNVLLIHNAGKNHPADSLQARVRAVIDELGIAGHYLANPRGSFIGVQNALATENAALRAEIAALRASKSYRLTAPLRGALRLQKRLHPGRKPRCEPRGVTD